LLVRKRMSWDGRNVDIVKNEKKILYVRSNNTTSMG